ncbi:MAG: hypothetical protein JO170_12490 [Verrucomicrobia bacterium]|nr:hypothetical protein [Verrucomicrobiota bacterium]
MKRLVVALVLILTPSAMVSVSKADIAGPFPRPTSPHARPSHPKTSPSIPPSPAAASPSASASEASPGLLNSGLTVAAVATTSLFGIVLIRKRND